ncbi:Gfo/Idh/MocA family protein [Halopiger thermotolerans]
MSTASTDSAAVVAVGLGGLGRVLRRSLANLGANIDVVAGVDVADAARDRFEAAVGAPAYADLGTALETHRDDLDAAIIATPHALHHEQAVACLEAGLDAFVEKPMVTDVADAVDLIETADRLDRTLAIGYQRHFHPAFVEIKRIVDSGRIGDVHAANAHLSQDWIDLQRGTWRANPELSGGGQLYDSGSHLLDALLWTTGATPRTVSAQMTFDSPGVDTDAALAIDLEGADGRPVTASVSVSGAGIDGEPAEGYAIWGTEGRLTYDGTRLRVTEDGATTYETEIDPVDFETLTERKLADFFAAREGGDPAVSGETGLEITALTEAAYRAAEEGRTVDVRALIDEARAAHAPATAD